MTFPASSSAALSGVCLVVEASSAAGSLALLRRTASESQPAVPASPAPGARHGHADAPYWRVLANVEIPMGSGRADLLTPALEPLLAVAQCSLQDLQAIACGEGPGSFTSLRIAGAFAKGLAFGLDLPLYAMPSLLLVSTSATTSLAAGPYLVVADALRNELYAQPCDVSNTGEIITHGNVFRVHEDALQDAARDRNIVRVAAVNGVHPHATSARFLGDWSRYGPVSLDGWEPAYGRLAEAQVKWEAAHGRALGD